MAIMDCPQCGKRISSHASICSFCGFQQGEVSEEDLEIFRARKLRDRIYRLNMISYAVITVFVAAFGWYWWESKGFAQSSSRSPFILMTVSALAYLLVRGLLFRARQLRKEMRRKMKMSGDLRRNL